MTQPFYQQIYPLGMTAGRESWTRIRNRRENLNSIIVESTLSGCGLAREVQRFRDAGNFVRIFFVSIASVKVSAERVRIRVKKGDHDVPMEDIRRRFRRTHVNVFGILPTPCRLVGNLWKYRWPVINRIWKIGRYERDWRILVGEFLENVGND